MQRVGVLSGFRRRGERGGAAAIVAVLLGGGVVMGFAAISMDVGTIMLERRQLQNGADAAAYAMARHCAIDPTTCVDNPAVNNENLAALNDANAGDDAQNGFDTSVYPNGICGRANLLPPCNAGSTPDLKECPALPAAIAANANIPYVEVHTITRHNGTSVLPTWLVKTLAGGAQGTTTKACARAAYGQPGTTVASAPITFSMCEWRANTANGANYVSSDPLGTPGYGGPGQPAWPSAATTPPTPGGEIIITLQGGPHMPTGCPNWQGHDTAGGFGYLTANGCNATVGQDNWVQVDTGNSSPCDLAPYLGRVIYLPVFDCVMRSLSQPTGAPPTSPADVCVYGTGSNTWYHISGWAKFYLSGYKTGGSQQAASLVSGAVPCNGGDRCISGWFLEGVLRDAPVASPPITPGNPNYGGYAVQPAG
jgi:hypothetical protein